MRFNKTFSNILNITFAYAGRALVIGVLGLGLSLTGCDDEGTDGNTDAAVDAAKDTNQAGDTRTGDTATADTRGDVQTADVRGDSNTD